MASFPCTGIGLAMLPCSITVRLPCAAPRSCFRPVDSMLTLCAPCYCRHDSEAKYDREKTVVVDPDVTQVVLPVKRPGKTFFRVRVMAMASSPQCPTDQRAPHGTLAWLRTGVCLERCGPQQTRERAHGHGAQTQRLRPRPEWHYSGEGEGWDQAQFPCVLLRSRRRCGRRCDATQCT